MRQQTSKPVVIVGAGLAGLTVGCRLAESGVPVVLVERENSVGGLARSFTYPNGATFDIGPHRFHTDSAPVKQFILDVLGDDHLYIDRNSQLFLFDRYLPWPMTLKNVLALPPQLMVRAGLDMFWPRKARTDSFEAYIVERYGRTLYKMFFQPYTEKFLDYTCSNLHQDWAATGINRATIDKRVDTSSLWAFGKSLLSASPPQMQFIYPRSGGIGVFGEKLAERIRRRGGRILLNSTVSGIQTADGMVESVATDSGEIIPAAHVFWSGSLTALREAGQAPESVPRLHYMSTVLFNYVTHHVIQPGFQWCYFGDKTMEASRACMPRRFNPQLAPAGKEALCIEVSCSESSETWRDPARLDCVVETFLLHARLLDKLEAIEDYHMERIHETYPLYVLNYPRKLRGMFEWVHGKWRNMTLIGRTGRFWYNNMDHSIGASLITAERYLSDCAAGTERPGEAYAEEDRYLAGTSG